MKASEDERHYTGHAPAQPVSLDCSKPCLCYWLVARAVT